LEVADLTTESLRHIRSIERNGNKAIGVTLVTSSPAALLQPLQIVKRMARALFQNRTAWRFKKILCFSLVSEFR
jgi:hypothetical protein